MKDKVIIRATRKLLQRLSAAPASDVEESTTLLGDWYATVLPWRSRQVALLVSETTLLVVEGEHDRLVLDAFWGSELRATRVAVLRMHGTKQLLATVDLDFVLRYRDVGVTVMVDHASMSRVNDARIRRDRLSPEEQKLRELADECQLRSVHTFWVRRNSLPSGSASSTRAGASSTTAPRAHARAASSLMAADVERLESQSEWVQSTPAMFIA